MKTCGASFMAGTICSDRAGHGGAHSAKCLTCGGDWIIGTCQCQYYCEICSDVVHGSEECWNVLEDGELLSLCKECYEGHPSVNPLIDAAGEIRSDPLTEDELAYLHESLGVQ